MQRSGHFPEIPGHRVIKLEAVGSVGRLYRIRSNTTHALVAAKYFSRKIVTHASFRQVVEEAIERLSPLRHPNVVRPLRLLPCGDTYVLLTEFVEGLSLRERFRQEGRLGEEQMTEYLLQAAEGLDAAARVGVLHYDLKPSNLLLSREGDLLVTDFWMRFHPYVESARGESVEELMEFPLYLSPEEREGRSVTAASNVFSLGAIFHHGLCGCPLQKPDGTRAARPEGTAAPLSRPCRRLLEALTAPHPEDRFPGSGAVVRHLQRKTARAFEPVEALLLAGVVLVVLSTLGFLFRAAPPAPKPGTPRGPAPALPEAPAPEAERAYLDADQFRFQHPEAPEGSLLRYRQVVEQFPETIWAYEAQRRIEFLGELRDRETRRRWEALLRLVERKEKEERYAEASDLLQSAEDPAWAKPLAEAVAARREALRAAERQSYQEARERAARLRAQRRPDRAAQELHFVWIYFASPEIRASAREELARLQYRPPEDEPPAPEE